MERRNEHLYPIFVTLLVMVGSVGYLNDIYNWGMNKAVLAGLLFVVVVVIHSCYLLRKQAIFYMVLSSLLLMEAICLLLTKDSFFSNPGRIDVLLRGGTVLAGAVLSYILTRIYIGKMLLLIGFLLMLVVEGAGQRMVSKISIAAILVFCILVIGEAMMERSLRLREKQGRSVSTSMLFLYIGAFVALCIVPVSENRFEWSYVRSAVQSVSNNLSDLLSSIQGTAMNSSGEFLVNMTGYSTDGKIGGRIIDQDKTVLTLSSDEPMLHSIYLAGNFKNVYKDNEWRESLSDGYQSWGASERQLDTVELLYSLYRYNRLGTIEPYLKNENISVTYEEISTTSIFHMLKMSSLGIDRGITSYTDALNPVFEEEMEEELSYSLEYYYLNYSSRSFYKYVTFEEGYSYQEENSVSPSDIREKVRENTGLSYIQVPDTLEELLRSRRQWIYDNYTAVPDTITDKVYELAKDITKDYEDNYDKLLAIESYLHKYSYQKSVGEIPEGTELVEYFLFDSQEGYCTYYATAMAVMARTLGIPTRYVQGFLVPINENGQKMATVNAMDAHAWVEAYIDGVGWLTFEPTAGCTRDKYDMLSVSAEDKTSTDKAEKQTIKASSGNELKGAGTMIVTAAAIIIVSGISVLLIRIRRNKRRYGRLSLADRLYYQVDIQLELFKHLGYSREKSETWSAFISRVAKENKEMEEALTKEIPVYEAVRYSKAGTREEQLEIFIHMNKIVMDKIRLKCSKMSYIYLIIKNELKRV